MGEPQFTSRDAEKRNDYDHQFFGTNFDYTHLPGHLRTVSKDIHHLVWDLLGKLPPNNQRTAMLEYALLMKDAAVRSLLKGQP